MAKEGIASWGEMDINTALREVLKTALIPHSLACTTCVYLSITAMSLQKILVEDLCAAHKISFS